MRASICEVAAPVDEAPVGVPNFSRVSDRLYRGGQPTAEGFRWLQSRGIGTVVNLRSYHKDEKLLRGLGLGYVHMVWKAYWPRSRNVARFLKVLRDPAAGAVFVHCQHGCDRTGISVALYRVIEQGWDVERAGREMVAFGLHRRWFPQILRFLRKVDVAKVSGLIESVEAPVRRVVK